MGYLRPQALVCVCFSSLAVLAVHWSGWLPYCTVQWNALLSDWETGPALAMLCPGNALSCPCHDLDMLYPVHALPWLCLALALLSPSHALPWPCSGHFIAKKSNIYILREGACMFIHTIQVLVWYSSPNRNREESKNSLYDNLLAKLKKIIKSTGRDLKFSRKLVKWYTGVG